jgi:hypothetical protein
MKEHKDIQFSGDELPFLNSLLIITLMEDTAFLDNDLSRLISQTDTCFILKNYKILERTYDIYFEFIQ